MDDVAGCSGWEMVKFISYAAELSVSQTHLTGSTIQCSNMYVHMSCRSFQSCGSTLNNCFKACLATSGVIASENGMEMMVASRGMSLRAMTLNPDSTVEKNQPSLSSLQCPDP